MSCGHQRSPCRAPPGTAPYEWVELGMTHLAEPSPSSRARAAACFKDAHWADPFSHVPALMWAISLLQGVSANGQPSAKEQNEAKELLQRAASLAHDEKNQTGQVTALRTLGDLVSATGDLDAATCYYGKALAISPDDCVLSASLANVHASRSALSDAATVLRAALAEDHACVLAHHGLARLLSSLDDLPGALRHARASLELRPFDPEYERTLEALLSLQAQGDGSRIAAAAAAAATAADDTTSPDLAAANAAANAAEASSSSSSSSSTSLQCGAPATWRSPTRPADLAPAGGVAACKKQQKKSKKGGGGGGGGAPLMLLINPFEEGCFHDDMRKKERQQYFSCGQFNNVLASLLHALALSRILCRTLVLPGFFIRFGARLTRVSPFAERWLPTSHFLNLTMLQQGFDVIELKEWLKQGEALRLPMLNARAVGHAAPQRRFFSHHNISFDGVRPATFPHFMQQQSELRWVTEDDARNGYFSHFQPGFGAKWWGHEYGAGSASASTESVLAFDSPPSIGLGMDSFQWDEALRYTRGHVRYVGAVHDEAAKVREALFGDRPYLAIHIRRGADRLHDFCHTGWGKKCFGWNITMDMCYPSTEAVAQHIKRAMALWKIADGDVFLATDSPRPELFEDILRETYGIQFARYGQQGPAATLGDEFGLPVDQTLCAAAPYFLGNVPSTVTATIAQERDSIGWARDRSDFFGFREDVELKQFREGWTPTEAFAPHYAYRDESRALAAADGGRGRCGAPSFAL